MIISAEKAGNTS